MSISVQGFSLVNITVGALIRENTVQIIKLEHWSPAKQRFKKRYLCLVMQIYTKYWHTLRYWIYFLPPRLYPNTLYIHKVFQLYFFYFFFSSVIALPAKSGVHSSKSFQKMWLSVWEDAHFYKEWDLNSYVETDTYSKVWSNKLNELPRRSVLLLFVHHAAKKKLT